MAAGNSPFPRWKQLIAQGIKDGMSQKQKGTLYYALSTVETEASAKSSGSGGAGKTPTLLPAPRVRMVVHRGFVNEQRSNSSDTGVEPYDAKFGSNVCLLTTTDIRAPKAQQILAQSQAKNAGPSSGAAGEVCWWMEHAMLQFRISGTMHILPRKDHPAAQTFNAQQLSPPPCNGGGDQASSAQFDWHKERLRIFEKLSPDLLASFTRPTPSGPHPYNDKLKGGQGPGEGDAEQAKDDTNSPWTLKLPQPGQEENEEQKKLLEEAERNFALIVIEPQTIDVVDLARDRRSLFTLSDPNKGPNSEWKEERLVP